MRCRHGFALLAALSLSCTREAPRTTAQQTQTPHPPFYTTAHVVRNGALEAGSIAPGRIATVYGEHLGPAKPCTAEAPATRLCDTEVHVGDTPATVLYVADGQINFRVPPSLPSSGTTQLRVIHKGNAGAPAPIALTSDAPTHTPQETANRMWSALQRVSWEQPYRKGNPNCTAIPAHPTVPDGGLRGHARYCNALDRSIITESLYYPVDPANPDLLLLRADIRPDRTDPEWDIEVEKLLARRLTQAYGPAVVPETIAEIGVMPRDPGLSWRAGDLTVFLHHNRTYVEPAGVRSGVMLIAVHQTILAQRPVTDIAVPHFAWASELEQLFPGRYFAPPPHPTAEQDRSAADRRTRAALLQLLRTPETSPTERAAALVAADDLTVRLGALLVGRTVQRGSEYLTVVADADNIRTQLAKHGVRYGEIGHYSGQLDYDRNLLRRAWNDYPDTIWGQRAFLMLQKLGCVTTEFPCPGPNCFLAVIEQGEKFLARYPDTPLRTEQIYNLALAHETWWSLSHAKPDDISGLGARVTRASAERARLRAIELFEELLRTAPGTREARAAETTLPRLKLKLDTGERAFFCFSC